jgi:hypothetical protein
VKIEVTLFSVVVAVLLGLSSHSMYAGTGDEPHYLAIAHSIAFDHDFDLSNNYGAAEPLLGDGHLEPEIHVRPGVGGVLRPVHDVGLPLLAAPAVRLLAPTAAWLSTRMPPEWMRRLRLSPSNLYQHLIETVMAIVGGILACLMWRTMIAAGADPGVARWSALVAALSPPLLIHSLLFFPDVLSAVLALTVFRRLTEGGGKPRPDGAAVPATRAWAIAGGATGLLFLVHARNAGLVAGLIAIAAVRLGRERSLLNVALAVVPFAALVALRTAIVHHFWGTWLTTPHEVMGEWTGWGDLAATAGTRLAGLLVDQEYGLLTYAPVFIVAGAGLAVMWRTNRPLLWKVAIAAGGYLVAVVLPITNVHGWTGGWSPPARFWVPIVPLVALGLPAGFRALPRPALGGVLVLQIAISGYFWGHPKNLWNDGDGRAAVCQRAGWNICRYLPAVPK